MQNQISEYLHSELNLLIIRKKLMKLTDHFTIDVMFT